MEKRIKAYESFLEAELLRLTRSNTSPLHRNTLDERTKLFNYHQHMLSCFQHERLIHMIIMFVFIAAALIITPITAYMMDEFPIESWLMLSPMMAISLILIILSFCYVKHYYFLENHIQKLYDKSAKILKYSCPDREKIKKIKRKAK